MALTGKRLDQLTALARPAYDALLYLEADPATNKYHRKLDLETVRGYIDVRDYGATGDGVTDDTAAIQAAENAADDANSDLYFPPGTYLISSTVEFSTGVSVLAAPGASIVETAALMLTPMFKWTNANDFTVEGLTFTGAQTFALFTGSAADSRCAIYLDTCSRFAVRDVKVTAKSSGFRLHACTAGQIERCSVIGVLDVDDGVVATSNYSYGVGIGVDSGQSFDIVVRDSYFEDIGVAVCMLAVSSRIHVIDNTIYDSCQGIYQSSGEKSVIAGNHIHHGVEGIKMRAGNHRIIGNYIEDMGVTVARLGSGIVMSNNTPAVDDENFVCVGNTVNGCTQYGIFCYMNEPTGLGVRGVTIADNTLVDCGDSALENGFGKAIYIAAGISDVTISGNTIRGDGASAVHGAIAVYGSAALPCEQVTIANNVIEDVNNTGLVASYTRNLQIVNNTFREVPETALYFVGAGTNINTRIEGNTFDNVTAAGVTAIYGNIAGCVSPAIIMHNQARGNFTTCVHTRCVTALNTVGWNTPDANAAIRVAAEKFAAQVTVIKSISSNDDASADDYQFDDDAANANEQVITLTNILPAYAELVSWQVRCFETVTGSASMQIDLGTSSGGAELGTGSPDTANDIIGTAAGAAPVLAATNAARSLYFSGTPGVNWDTPLNAGRWALMLTYIDYGQIYTQESP